MANIRRMTKKRLGELLLQEGLIKDEQLELGLEEQQQTGELIGEILVRKGYVNESDIARIICTQFSFPYLSVSHYYIAPELKKLFDLETLEKYLFVPIDKFGDVMGIVIAGLLDQDILDEIEKKTKCTIQIYVGKVSEVKQVIREKFAEEGRPAVAGGATMQGQAGAATAVVEDVTAPPTAKGAAKKKKADEKEEVGEETAAAEAGVSGDEEKSDDAVVRELEQQFKKFRFFDDDPKKKGEEKEDTK